MTAPAEQRPVLPDGITAQSVTTGTAICLAEEMIVRFDEHHRLTQLALSDHDSYTSSINSITEAMSWHVIVGSVGLLFVRAFGSCGEDSVFDHQLWLSARSIIEKNIRRVAEYADSDEVSVRIAASEVVNGLLLPISIGAPTTDMLPLIRMQEDALYTHVNALLAAASIASYSARQGMSAQMGLGTFRHELQQSAVRTL